MKINVRCNIGTLLEAKGQKQTWLAEQIGATRQQMNNWCNNGSLPSIGYILRMIKATGWKLEEMFEEVKEEIE